MPLIIGVAGSIATGKSAACEMLVAVGAHHCDADRLVHRLYDPGTGAFDRIVAIFGPGIVGENGYIDRRILGAKVFGQPEEMSKLTSAIGSINDAVKGVVERWCETLSKDDVALLEAVNLIEAGYGRWCDQVWLVACDEAIARRRLTDRNRFTSEEVDQRLASQRPWRDREPAADLLLLNDGTIEELEALVRTQFRSLRQRWSDGALEHSRYQEWWLYRQADAEADRSR